LVLTLKKLFKPDLIVVGSNTLSFTVKSHSNNIFTVLPPLTEAKKITKSKSIAILATESIVKSKLLDNYITNFKMNDIKITNVNASFLVELVENGNFYSNPNLCKNIIKKTLSMIFVKNNIDVVTLSSTHLPFLKELFQNIFPNITFLDPSESLAKKLKQKYSDDTKRNSLQIFTSGNTNSLQTKLKHLGIKNKISKLTID
jgi:glutamate racemase